MVVFPDIFILRLLGNIPPSAQQKVLLMKQEDISGMEECQIPVWASYIMFQHQWGAYFAFPERKFSRGELYFE
jgi:hypothetical protein